MFSFYSWNFHFREILIVVGQDLHLVMIIVMNMNAKLGEVTVEAMETVRKRIIEEKIHTKKIVTK